MPGEDPFVDILQEWIQISMHRSMNDFIRFTRENGLSMSQIGALLHIQHHGSSGVSDLGEHLGVTSAAVSQMLDRLVEQGLILRTEDPHDRRVKQIVLAEKGHRVLQGGIKARQNWLDELTTLFTKDEKEEISSAMKILIEKTRYPG